MPGLIISGHVSKEEYEREITQFKKEITRQRINSEYVEFEDIPDKKDAADNLKRS